MITRRTTAVISSPIRKRSVFIHGHPTSVSLEAEFWNSHAFLSRRKRTPIQCVIEMVDLARQGNYLSSALRLFVLPEPKAVRLHAERAKALLRTPTKGNDPPRAWGDRAELPLQGGSAGDVDTLQTR